MHICNESMYTWILQVSHTIPYPLQHSYACQLKTFRYYEVIHPRCEVSRISPGLPFAFCLKCQVFFCASCNCFLRCSLSAFTLCMLRLLFILASCRFRSLFVSSSELMFSSVFSPATICVSCERYGELPLLNIERFLLFELAAFPSPSN